MKRAMLAVSSTVVGLWGLFSYHTPSDSAEAVTVVKVLGPSERQAATAVTTEPTTSTSELPASTTAVSASVTTIAPATTTTAASSPNHAPLVTQAPATHASQGAGSTTPSTAAPTTQKPVTTTTTTAPKTTTTVAGPVTTSAAASIASPGHGTITVTVTVSNRRVTACSSSASGLSGESTQYNKQSTLNDLCSKAVATNYSQVSKSGGATLTSAAFNKALFAARTAAGL